jgi:hypothetical protein
VAFLNQYFGIEANSYLVVKVVEYGRAYSQVGVVVLFIDHLGHVELISINEIAVYPKAYLFNFEISWRLHLLV